ncbi:ferredoxin [Georgenia muralis]|uniref:Ferredoxin n=1 Tax=Georgenia muralis TaxID=154117 RepID=A0A3N4YYV6_9MICO|nr:ferredoxin [Georgenia muralis]RPF26349.1 ferredoxin [Georgenia muralis]
MTGAPQAAAASAAARTAGAGAAAPRLRVDPVTCDGIGACALAAPDLVDLDPWGFPLIPRRGLAPAELAAAHAAARACPRQALWFQSR